MPEGLRLAPHNSHEVEVDGRRILFHVPTTSLFELDDVAADVLDLFRRQAEVSADDLRAQFDGRHAPERVLETLEDLLELEVISNGRPRPATGVVQITNYPISTLVLNVNTGCNLSCSYCYKEDLATPDRGQKMAFETAAKSFELLLREAKDRKRVNLVFFGGEPLSNMPLIRSMVDYAERRAAEDGKTVDFSLTTNATLLTEDLVDWLSAHRFGITISMDGPKALHDRNRKTVGGKGTYDVVAKKARMLLAPPAGTAGRRPRHPPGRHRRRRDPPPPQGRDRLLRGRVRAGDRRRHRRLQPDRGPARRRLPGHEGAGLRLSRPGAGRRQQRLRQHAPADDRPARRHAQVAALRRRTRHAGDRRRRPPPSVPPLRRTRRADVRLVDAGIDAAPRRVRRRRPGPQPPAAPPAASDHLLRRLLPRVATPATATRPPGRALLRR